MKSCSLTALMLAFALVAPGAAADRPNILFIFTDDHAPHALSCYGSYLNETPNLDRIANEGMLFENCFCTNSICGPSRAVIQTGKYSHKNGFYDNGNKFDGRQQTFPKLLRQSGYATAVIGKWHLGEHMAPQGYDYSEVLRGQGPYYNPLMLLDADGDGQKDSQVQHTGYTTDIITDLALEWLKNGRDQDKPFLLMYQHKAPHREWAPGPDHLTLYDDREMPEPINLFDDYATRGRAAHEQDMSIEFTMTARDLKLEPPPYLNEEQLSTWNAAYDAEERRPFARRTSAGATSFAGSTSATSRTTCDASPRWMTTWAVSSITWTQTGLADNTVVVYSSDQGFYLGDHGWFDKRFMYEESYRQPLMVRWPGVVAPNSVSRELVSNVDFAETFLEVAGVEVPADMQGRSLVPILKGETPDDWRKAHYYQYYEFQGNSMTAHMVRRHYGVRTDRFKLIHFYNIDEWELYDLAKDPHEMRNVYGDETYAAVVTDLKAEIQRLQQELEVPDDTGSVESHPESLRKLQQQREQQRTRSARQPS